jgi:hypothetical protein
MNEASRWRHALAQQIAPHYSANPKVTAVILGGSASQGCADRFSDIDLTVFWTELPTEKERREIIKRARGRRGHLLPYKEEEICWPEQFEVEGLAIDVRHMTVEAIELILVDVLERADPSLAKQQHLATLLSSLPLSDPAVLTHWQQQAMVYPQELSEATVGAHLRFRPGWELEMLAERSELLALYETFCTIEKQVLLVLIGLNHLYYPGWRWVDRLMEQMHLAPPSLAERFKQLFGIVSIDPLASVYQLHDLIEETFRLVEIHLSELDITLARSRFLERRRVWNMNHVDLPGGPGRQR